MQKKLKWGILSCSKICNDFTVSLSNYEDEHEVIAVADYNYEMAKDFAKKFGIKKVYDNYLDIVKDPEIDVVYISTRNMHHYSAAKLAIENGKACLVEKPITCCPTTTRKLFELAKEKRTFVMEALWSNFCPAYIKLRELLKSGVIGDLVHIQSTFMDNVEAERVIYKKFGGGVIFDIGIYTINSILVAVDYQHPTKIKAVGNLYSENESECTVTAVFEFPNNVTASAVITGRTTHDYINEINSTLYIGTKGYIKLSAMVNCPEYLEVNGVRYDTSAADSKSGYLWDNTYGLRYEAQEVRKCILNQQITSSIHKPEHTICLSDCMAALHKEIGMEIAPTIETIEFKNI